MDWKTEIEGPFWPRYKIIVGGFHVPYLSISPPMNEKKEPAPLQDDQIFLSLDERIGIYTTRDELLRWAPFIADCMAVSAGYPCHSASEKMNPHAHKMSALGAVAPEKPNLVIVKDEIAADEHLRDSPGSNLPPSAAMPPKAGAERLEPGDANDDK